LETLKEKIIKKLYNIIDSEGSEVKTSFLVYESFKKLTNSDVKTEYRGLEMLRTAKSSFDPKHS